MASHEWCYEFCLSCDRQISEGAIYCSQACRLADIEKAGSDSQSASNLSSSASSSSSSNNGFYLPPAVNFSAYKATPASRGFDMGSSSNYHYYPTTHGSYFAPPTATRQSPQRSLTPSSSRSSLASNASQPKPQPQPAVSHQAASQLSSYERSFDQTRDMKRRFTSY